jgi:hypothetical protein
MARDFNGTSDQLDIGDATEIDISTLSATVGAWVWADTLNNSTFHHCIIGRGRGSTSGWKFGFGGSNANGRMIFTKKQVADIQSGVSFAPSTGAWFFCAAVLSSTQVRFVKITAAGTLTTSTTSNSSAMDNTPAPSEARIGCDRSSGGADTDWFDGKIAHVGVWIGDELTDDELKAYAFGGLWAVGRQPDGYWPLWGVASPEPDLTASQNHGTVTGATLASVHPPMSVYVPRPGWISRLTAAAGGTAFTQTLGGALTLAGLARKAVADRRLGALTSSGVLRRAVGLVRGGTLTSSGRLVRAVSIFRGGTLSSSGVLRRGVSHIWSGVLSLSGALVNARGYVRVFAGSLGLAGSARKDVTQLFFGSLSFSGRAAKAVGKVFSGVLSLGATIANFFARPRPPLTYDVELSDPSYLVALEDVSYATALEETAYDVVLQAPVLDATLSDVGIPTEES